MKDLQSLRDKRSEQIAERNKQIEEGLFKLASDPRDPVTAPQRQPPAPQLNFAPLLNAPGFYTGYGVKTIPGVREAIEQG